MQRNAVVCTHACKTATKTEGRPEERWSVSIRGDCWAVEAMYQTRQKGEQEEGKPGCGRWQLGEREDPDFRRQWVSSGEQLVWSMSPGIRLGRETERQMEN